jgi:hypothetical protein
MKVEHWPTSQPKPYARNPRKNDSTRSLRAPRAAPTGYPIQSPYVSVASKALEQMPKLLTEFGMTPSSRGRINATPFRRTKAQQAIPTHSSRNQVLVGPGPVLP